MNFFCLNISILLRLLDAIAGRFFSFLLYLYLKLFFFQEAFDDALTKEEEKQRIYPIGQWDHMI